MTISLTFSTAAGRPRWSSSPPPARRGQGHLLGQYRLGPARLAHCMRWLGQAETALEMMVDRSLNRYSHGSVLAEKQGIQWLIAESTIELYQAKLMVLHAASLIDAGGNDFTKVDFRGEVSMTKHFVANMLNRVIDRAIQVHGALGYSTDTPLAGMMTAGPVGPVRRRRRRDPPDAHRPAHHRRLQGHRLHPGGDGQPAPLVSRSWIGGRSSAGRRRRGRHRPRRPRRRAGRRLGPRLGPPPGAARASSTAPRPQCPIDTVVVLMMENRSFDHYLGWLADDDAYLEARPVALRAALRGRRRAAPGLHRARRPTGAPPTTSRRRAGPTRGGAAAATPIPATAGTAAGPSATTASSPTGSGNDEYALGYFGEADLPCYGPLARHFTVFDRYFASVMTGTYPNRYYLHAAQGDGTVDGSLPIVDGGLGLRVRHDLGQAQGRRRAVPLLRHRPPGHRASGAPGTSTSPARSPSTCWPRPPARCPTSCSSTPASCPGMRTDDHPHGDMRTAQAFVAAVVGTLMRGPQWERSAVIVTYDEWGGFFDHVRPPVFADDRGTADDLTNWGQAGFRLPVFLASPFARPGYVDHRTYDHASVLRFLEWRFLGAPAEGTARRRAGGSPPATGTPHNIGSSLAPTRQSDFVLDPGTVPLVLTVPCQGQFFQDVPGLSQLEDAVDPARVGVDAGVDSSTHALAAAAEPFSALGYDVGPSMPLASSSPRPEPWVRPSRRSPGPSGSRPCRRGSARRRRRTPTPWELVAGDVAGRLVAQRRLDVGLAGDARRAAARWRRPPGPTLAGAAAHHDVVDVGVGGDRRLDLLDEDLLAAGVDRHRVAARAARSCRRPGAGPGRRAPSGARRRSSGKVRAVLSASPR